MVLPTWRMIRPSTRGTRNEPGVGKSAVQVVRMMPKPFAATATGYAALGAWVVGFGRVVKVGVEGTGTYGAGLARHLASAACAHRATRRLRRPRLRRLTSIGASTAGGARSRQGVSIAASASE